MIVSGSLIYFALKFFGYSLFGMYLNARFKSDQNIWLIGLLRTLVGIILGAAVQFPFLKSINMDPMSFRNPGSESPLYFLFLIILRLFVWVFIVHVFYRKQPQFREKWKLSVVTATGFSFFLDLPVLLGLFAVATMA